MTFYKDLPYPIVYFSKLNNTLICNEDNISLGRFADFFVEFSNVFPQVSAIQYKRSGHYFYIEWGEIISFSYKKIIIRNNSVIREGKNYPRISYNGRQDNILRKNNESTILNYPGLGKVILDKQIVDTHGKKVVRVNDIHFIKVGKNLRVTHAAVGIRSMFRRLGLEYPLKRVSKVLNWKGLYNESLISWKFVHAIPDKSMQQNVELNITNEFVKEIHPADLADILEDLNSQGRKALFGKLDPITQAKTLWEVDQDFRKGLLDTNTPQNTAKILEEMDADEVVDILSDLDGEKTEEIIDNISDEDILDEIKELMVYKESTAGGLMSKEVLTTFEDKTCSEVLQDIFHDANKLKTVYCAYVIDKDNTLKGVCPLRVILTQHPNSLIRDIMITKDIKGLDPQTHWKEIASTMSKYDLHYVPIINKEKTLLGIISLDDILPWLLGERS